jgi:hypothetical protein
MNAIEIRTYDQNIANEGLIWYSIWDFNEIRKENKAAVQEALDACVANGTEVVHEFMKSSLRGPEYCYQGNGGKNDSGNQACPRESTVHVSTQLSIHVLQTLETESIGSPAKRQGG